MLDFLLQQLIEIVVGILHVLRQLTAVQCTDVEPAQGGERRERGLVALLFHLLHLLDKVYHLLADVVECLIAHLLHVLLLTSHHSQTCQHLLDSHSDHRTAYHARIP